MRQTRTPKQGKMLDKLPHVFFSIYTCHTPCGALHSTQDKREWSRYTAIKEWSNWFFQSSAIKLAIFKWSQIVRSKSEKTTQWRVTNMVHQATLRTEHVDECCSLFAIESADPFQNSIFYTLSMNNCAYIFESNCNSLASNLKPCIAWQIVMSISWPVRHVTGLEGFKIPTTHNKKSVSFFVWPLVRSNEL